MIFALLRNGRIIQVTSRLFWIEGYKKGDEIISAETLAELLPSEETPKEKDHRCQPVRAKYPGTKSHIFSAQ